jgi:hypothetical protein
LNQGFSSGGYFVQEVIKGKLSIINLNSMYFFSKNDDVSDCGSSNSPSTTQMKWLETTLKSFAQKKGQHQVYIMGHVPPIDDDGSRLFKSKCYTQYFDLLGQYGNVIAGHFTGHTNSKFLDIYKS